MKEAILQGQHGQSRQHQHCLEDPPVHEQSQGAESERAPAPNTRSTKRGGGEKGDGQQGKSRPTKAKVLPRPPRHGLEQHRRDDLPNPLPHGTHHCQRGPGGNQVRPVREGARPPTAYHTKCSRE